ncbi:unnamed protein product [Hyaloperonospora brassicae]|uniref:Glutathione S-transferase n=1 Tax=Hyaloperonospora brassicae TaxID=162125 RepID=A0AAV0SZH7_HYABA|nr:unnamed protein product [Hyaloperonospora brassicae]
MSTFPSLKLTDFTAAGRAEAARLVFYIGGVPFEDKRLTPAQFMATKDSFPLGQVPTLEVNGDVMTQSYAIMRYAGRLGGLYPTTRPELAIKIDEVLSVMGEIEVRLVPSLHESDVAKKKAMREELTTATLPRYAGLLEARLAKMKQTPFFQSDRVYVHEVAIYVWVKSLRSGFLDFIPTTVLNDYKLLNAMHDKVASHPQVQEWYRLEHNAPKLKLTYFPNLGRGEPIRLAFFIGDIAFEDERIPHEEMVTRRSTLPFGQFPVLEVNGEMISQALAILRYAGTMSGLYPMTDPLAAYRIDELLSIMDDMFNKPLWGASHREKNMEKKDVLRAELAKVVPKTIGFLEKRIAKNEGPYAAGQALSVADLAIYAVLVDFTTNLPKLMSTMEDSYPSVYRVYDQVRKHPKVVEWNAAHGQQ